MKSFLYETAEDIIKNNSNNLQNCLLIFPNKRTKYYFRRYYAQIIGKSSRPPKMTEIGKLIREITGFEDAEKLTLVFELFRVFQKYDNRYSFDAFYRIGEIILSDFNEIDAWLVDPQQIYRNIKDLKEIDAHFDWLTDEQKKLLSDFWKNFLTEKSSKEKEMFIGLWNLLPKVYASFFSRLKNKKIAYNGMIYKILSDMIDADEMKPGNYHKIIFIGFNALNKAELKFFRYFKKQGNTQFFWDADNYYFVDKKQEAGDFIRKNFFDLQLKSFDFPNNFIQNKQIDIIGTSLNINQAKLLHPILANKNKDFIENTAIVTADESMLFPVLSALPGTVESINVTMGYSFKFTPLYNFIVRFLKMHLFAEKHKSKNLYFKDVLNILKHPYIKEYNSALSEKMISLINEKKMIYINPENLLLEEDNKLMRLIFFADKKEKNSQIFLDNLLNILFVFFDKNKIERENNSLKNEYIFRAYKKIKRFREILIENNETLSLKLSSEILIQILKSDNIPFESESNEGLQIMGLMESRNLDFKNVIILGVNEGNLPKISRAPTFISQSLRYTFNLPLIKHQDAVFAYFFYRLLQRAENITLIYNDLVNDANSGEMSRFILQLLYESDFQITHRHVNDEIVIRNRERIEIEKDNRIFEKLNRYIIQSEESGTEANAFSASALNTYLTCSLKFYFKYLAGIKEADKSEDELSPAEFGSILHSVTEQIYRDLTSDKTNETISKEMINKKLSETEKYVFEAFKNYFKNNSNYSSEGIQIVIQNVLNAYVKTILRYDESYAPFKIISLEKENFYNTLLDIKINSQNKKVKLFGIIDRIDKKEGIFRIIDYKSGSRPKGIISIENLFDGSYNNRDSHAFQALFYTLILSENKDFSGLKVRPSLYYARLMNRTDFSDTLVINDNSVKLALDENVTEKILPDFKEKLTKLIEEIFDINSSFKMTDDVKKCEYCEFYKICY